MNKRKGISLIVLVITILVMIILAGVVVVSLQKNNPIEKAKTAKDTSNLSALKEELELYKTNELMLGNKDANNISFTETEAKDILKNIPENLKEKVVVSNGKLGVYYSKITEEAQDYARENDIFDAEDKVAPDADVYVEERAGKKYVVCDSVDYESDIANIACSNGEHKNINANYEKVGYRRVVGSLNYEDILKKKIDMKIKNFKEISNLNDLDEINKYNVIILSGSFYYSYYNYALGDDKETENKLINFLNSGTHENPKVIITMGNDSECLTQVHPIIKANQRPVRTTQNLEKQSNIDNIITRQIDDWANKYPNNAEDSMIAIQVTDSPYVTEYYKNTNGPAPYDGCIAMYQDKSNGRAWFHMQNSPHFMEGYMKDSYQNTILAAIYKMTGSRSMEINVTGVAPGTKYSFTVTDLAGNKTVKEITL